MVKSRAWTGTRALIVPDTPVKRSLILQTITSGLIVATAIRYMLTVGECHREREVFRAIISHPYRRIEREFPLTQSDCVESRSLAM